MNRQQVYMYVDVGNSNSNKFWRITQEGSNVKTNWGRVGDSPQEKNWTFSSENEATKEFDKKCKDKVRKGYEKVEVVGTGYTCDNPKGLGQDLAAVALRDISYDNQNTTTRDLITYLTQQNIHAIIENTRMQYNEVSGVFTTPLGVVVGQNTIDKARNILATIKSKDSSQDFQSLTNQYLRLVPQNLGRARSKLNVEQIWALNNDTSFLLKIQQQADLLDSLEASLKTVLTNPAEPGKIEATPEKVFDCKLDILNHSDTINSIKKLYKSTWQTIHESSAFEVSKVYTVDISNMRTSWESYGAKLLNVKRLWHGTKPSNVLSILKKGLIIPPANASYCAGRAFGNGVYFSDQSTKSLNYACGYWDGNRVNRCFMFLADVSLGKTFTPMSYDRSLPKPGYDSTSALAGKSGVINNEFIVYRLDQANLVYLVEFEK